VSQAAQAIGLRVKLDSLGPNTFFSLFVDSNLRKGVDLFPTVNAATFADPGPYLATFAIPGAPQNFSGWQDPEVSRLLAQARSTANDMARAELTTKADKLVTRGLPWIPMAQLDSVLITRKQITGAPASYVYEDGSWADTIGSSGK
jgi:peptide/nickel transport system substrate-binding protein